MLSVVRSQDTLRCSDSHAVLCGPSSTPQLVDGRSRQFSLSGLSQSHAVDGSQARDVFTLNCRASLGKFPVETRYDQSTHKLNIFFTVGQTHQRTDHKCVKTMKYSKMLKTYNVTKIKKRYIYYVQLTCLMPNNPRIK